MIPTRSKSKLPNTLSWPLGAEAISGGLADVPHAADLTLWFADSPVWSASAFHRLLRESRPYAVLVADYQPALQPGYIGSTALIEAGWYDVKWELRVNPVKRPLKSTVGALLRCRPSLNGFARPNAPAGRGGIIALNWCSRRRRVPFPSGPPRECRLLVHSNAWVTEGECDDGERFSLR